MLIKRLTKSLGKTILSFFATAILVSGGIYAMNLNSYKCQDQNGCKLTLQTWNAIVDSVEILSDTKADTLSVYTRVEIDEKDSLKADKKDTYTKSEVDAKFVDESDIPACLAGEVLKSNGTSFLCVADKVGGGDGTLNVENYYTKEEINNTFVEQIDLSEYYTKNEITENFVSLPNIPTCQDSEMLSYDGNNFSCVADKVGTGDIDLSEYYTKKEITENFVSLPNIPTCQDSEMLSYDGNKFSCVTDKVGEGETDLSNYYNKAQSNDNFLSKKALPACQDGESLMKNSAGILVCDNFWQDGDKAVIEILDEKADKSETYTRTTIDTRMLEKADKATTYTRTTIDNKLGQKLSETDGYTRELAKETFVQKSQIPNCGENEVLRSVGATFYCVGIEPSGMDFQIVYATGDTGVGNTITASCPAGKVRISCSGGVLDTGVSTTGDNEAHVIRPLGNGCSMTYDSEGAGSKIELYAYCMGGKITDSTNYSSFGSGSSTGGGNSGGGSSSGGGAGYGGGGGQQTCESGDCGAAVE